MTAFYVQSRLRMTATASTTEEQQLEMLQQLDVCLTIQQLSVALIHSMSSISPKSQCTNAREEQHELEAGARGGITCSPHILRAHPPQSRNNWWNKLWICRAEARQERSMDLPLRPCCGPLHWQQVGLQSLTICRDQSQSPAAEPNVQLSMQLR